jgi:hypothetical protein
MILLTKEFSATVLPGTGWITDLGATLKRPTEEDCDGFACFTDDAFTSYQTTRKEEAE